MLLLLWAWSQELFLVGSLMVFGFIKGFQPIAGFSYGAKKYDRLHEASQDILLWSTIFCTIFRAAAASFSSSIISGFTEGDMEMIRAGQKALRANGLSFLLFGFYTVYSSLFLALGKAKEGFITWCMQARNLFCPRHLYYCSGLWGISGTFAQPIADVISAFVTIFGTVSSQGT